MIYFTPFGVRYSGLHIFRIWETSNVELDIQCGAEKHKKYNSLIALITFQKDLEGGGQQRERVDKRFQEARCLRSNCQILNLVRLAL